MTKKAFDRIAAGLEAAIDYAEGRARVEDYVVHVPAVDVPAVDVAALRRRLELSQSLFAARFGFDPADVRSWEDGASPEGAVRALNGPHEQSAA